MPELVGDFVEATNNFRKSLVQANCEKIVVDALDARRSLRNYMEKLPKSDKRQKKIEAYLDNTEKIVENITEITGAIKSFNHAVEYFGDSTKLNGYFNSTPFARLSNAEACVSEATRQIEAAASKMVLPKLEEVEILHKKTLAFIKDMNSK